MNYHEGNNMLLYSGAESDIELQNRRNQMPHVSRSTFPATGHHHPYATYLPSNEQTCKQLKSTLLILRIKHLSIGTNLGNDSTIGKHNLYNIHCCIVSRLSCHQGTLKIYNTQLQNQLTHRPQSTWSALKKKNNLLPYVFILELENVQCDVLSPLV
jgi:hypothetical protein